MHLDNWIYIYIRTIINILIAVCCSVLQCVAVCCSVLHIRTIRNITNSGLIARAHSKYMNLYMYMYTHWELNPYLRTYHLWLCPCSIKYHTQHTQSISMEFIKKWWSCVHSDNKIHSYTHTIYDQTHIHKHARHTQHTRMSSGEANLQSSFEEKKILYT